MTQTVKEFLDRTNTRHKHYTFSYDDDFGNNICIFSVWEVANEYTRNGGKLFNIDENELGRRFGELRGFNNCFFSIGRGA